MSNKNPNESTRWKKGGPSPNPTGRPRNSKNAYSLKKFSEELGKCRGESLEYVKKAMREAEKPADMLKAAIAIWTQDKIVQQMMYDQVMNEIKLEQEKVNLELSKEKLEKLKGESSEDSKQEVEESTPIISFTAHKGGKQ